MTSRTRPRINRDRPRPRVNRDLEVVADREVRHRAHRGDRIKFCALDIAVVLRCGGDRNRVGVRVAAAE